MVTLNREMTIDVKKVENVFAFFILATIYVF